MMLFRQLDTCINEQILWSLKWTSVNSLFRVSYQVTLEQNFRTSLPPLVISFARKQSMLLRFCYLELISCLKYFLWRSKTLTRQGVSFFWKWNNIFPFKMKLITWVLVQKARHWKLVTCWQLPLKFWSPTLNFWSHWQPAGPNSGPWTVVSDWSPF